MNEVRELGILNYKITNLVDESVYSDNIQFSTVIHVHCTVYSIGVCPFSIAMDCAVE